MIKKFFSEITALNFTPWYRWHPQIAMRYLPVVERINNFKMSDLGVRQGQTLSILEVGSGGLGIAPYLKMPVTGVDREFEPPFHPLLKKIKGDATNLKFENNSFDVVISMDMLEHLPKEKRGKATYEMLRVAGRLVIIGVPCGKAAEEHDQEMKDKGDKRNKGDRGFKFLEEQMKYGLPDESDILYYIKVAAGRLKKDVRIKIKGNMNIKLREFLMRGWMSKSVFVNILFRKVFLLFIPILRLLDRSPFYRKIFLVSLKRSDPSVRQGRTLI